jgi:methionyl aminopeptidase
MGIIKSKDQIQAARESGKILATAVFATLEQVKPGITTDELDAFFAECIAQHGAEASFLGYNGYPKSICTSVNDEVVHAIPGSRVLQEGDIIGVDCGVRYKGMCTDMARTVAVGSVSDELTSLMNVTEQALRSGIQQLHPGNRIGDVGAAVERHAHDPGYGIVRVLVGHGVGEDVHEEPQVPNYGKAGSGRVIEEGMILAVEPMFNLGTEEVDFDEEDGWTVRTADGSMSAHFEDTIAVTKNGPEVLTRV